MQSSISQICRYGGDNKCGSDRHWKDKLELLGNGPWSKDKAKIVRTQQISQVVQMKRKKTRVFERFAEAAVARNSVLHGFKVKSLDDIKDEI